MFFSFFKRNLKSSLFLVVVFTLNLFPYFTYIAHNLDFFKSHYIAVVIFGPPLIFPFATLLAYFNCACVIYPHKLRIFLQENSDSKFVEWYFYSQKSWNKSLKAFFLLPFVAIIYILGPLFYMILDVILDAKKVLSQPKDATVPFQKLPFSIQYRFFQLQPPVTRFNLLQAYPTKWIFEASKPLIVDSMEIDLKETYKYFHINLNEKRLITAEPNWRNDENFYHTAQFVTDPYDQLVFRLRNAETLQTSIMKLRNIISLRRLVISSLYSNQLSFFFKFCHLCYISKLEIIYSFLSKKDLLFLKEFKNLNFIRLSLKNDIDVDASFIKDVLDCVGGIPNIRIYFDCNYNNIFFCEILLVLWYRKFGPIESIFVTFKDDTVRATPYITFASEYVSSFWGMNKNK